MDMGADVQIVNHDEPQLTSDTSLTVNDAAITHDDATPNSNNDISIKSEEDLGPENGDDGGATHRPSKRRRLEEFTPQQSASRPVSPPWKSFSADGPTTIITGDGIRKSTRVNKEAPVSTPEPAKRSTRHATKSTQTNGHGKNHNNGRQNGSRAVSGPTSLPKGKPTPALSKKASVASLKSSGAPPSRKSERHRKSSVSVAQPAEPVPSENTKKRPGRPRRITQSSADNPGDDPSTPTSSYNYTGFRTSPLDSSASASTPRLRLRLRTQEVPNCHPQHAPPPPKYPTFADWLQQDDPLEGEESQRITQEQADEEAERRLQIVEAAENGILSQAKCSIFAPEPAEEPPPRYGHWEHVVAHALHFNKLLREENTYHRRMAKTLAKEAVDYWKEKYKRKTQDEIELEEAERALLRYKQVIKDVKDAWGNVKVQIDKERIAKWEEEQLQLGHKAMDDMFNQAQEILGRGMADSASSFVSDDESAQGADFEADESNASGEANPDDIMSSSSDSEDDNGKDEDANLTAEQLRAKYGQLPDLPDISSEEEEDENEDDGTPEPTPDPDIEMEDFSELPDHPPASTNGIHSTTDDAAVDVVDPAHVELETVDDILLDSDDDDEGSGSGSEEWPSDEESEEEEQAESESDDGDDMGVLGFLAPNEIKKMKDAAKANMQNEENGEIEESDKFKVNGVNINHSEPDEDENEKTMPKVKEVEQKPTKNGVNGHAIDTRASPSIEVVDSEAMDHDAVENTESRSRSRHTSSPPRTEIPSLLRGTLREYQHGGLDWLANLYDSDTNGILADEMGLGKTIQTIAILAYVAVFRQSWGPHLVVVPTSVMLNWEMEFKKWCPGFKILTYYGDINERKRKRSGWRTTGRDMYNVVITSYQLILQDASAFKMRAWQYLILDEAHNIKNFKSQRWQTMLNLRTERRLLLTGTPLQNNIDELWSLLYFLMPAGFAGEGRIAGLEEFTMALKNPTSQILDQGRQQLDAEAQKIVRKLHEVLRPYLLRRLKADVEKQMPAKYEHVVYCKLSKRQRQLYDGFMGRASTKSILSSGNYMSIINCLMSLRKVCNHPDLFETRAIVTSMAMPKSVVAAYEIKDLLIRKRLHANTEEQQVNLDALNLVFAHREQTSIMHARRAQKIRATRPLEDLIERQTRRLNAGPAQSDTTSLQSVMSAMANREHAVVRDHLQTCLRLTRARTQFLPIYGRGLIERVTMDYQDYAFGGCELKEKIKRSDYPPKPLTYPTPATTFPGQFNVHGQIHAPQARMHIPHQQIPPQFSAATHGSTQAVEENNKGAEKEIEYMFYKKGEYGFRAPHNRLIGSDWYQNKISIFDSLVPTLEQRAELLEPTVTRFTCVTPAVAAEEVAPLTLSKAGVEKIRSSPFVRSRDPFHEARIRQSIAFPDKRLLQYDCGKLQRLAVLLRDLQAGGHRALIFTQMTKVLDILEQFLNIHGHRYLRLDGATKVEQRQILTDRFNNDPRILCFILSSRSGGLGINLTGADTVIFYDLDWNPAMDKQCQDRSHRIGQTRDVHIYKFVSEYTIEANILRKSNQKRLLDDVIIQKGDFTTDYFNKVTWRDALASNDEPVDEAGAAMDRVLGEKAGLLGDSKVMQTVEDTEDQNAATVAQKEIVDEIHDDQVDFSESSTATPANATTRQTSEAMGEGSKDADEEKAHVDEYMLKLYREEYGKEPYRPPTDRQKRNRKGQDVHRTTRKKKY